jgi:multimeric flavodoxin WrbA
VQSFFNLKIYLKQLTTMKALLINGSPRANGNTHQALTEVANQLKKHGIDSTIIWIGVKPVQGCISCHSCLKTGRCAFTDTVYNDVRTALEDADAVIVGSPTYYGGPNGSLCALLDRVFYSSQRYLQNKVWAAVTICRRGGSTAAFQRLNMYADMSNMIHATSQYWNIVFGGRPGEVQQDAEGLQTMRTLADNIAWLVNCTHNNPAPERNDITWTNFIR